ncbi:MAG: NeuD/PglB/VioB family sugar acetyltransferase [Methylococcales bacterium]|nr:NeuD/PglB/VioB family sugar acetyltransferase [Methylococcales bacterium]
MEKIVLLGGGGHCKSCIDVIEQEEKYDIIGILDQPSSVGETIFGYDIIGADIDIEKYVKYGCNFLVTVGQITSPLLRKNIFSKLKSESAKLATIISPRAYLSKHAMVGVGTILMHDSLVNAGAILGENCIINSKALIEHDVTVEDHCHISTSAVVNGGVTIREGTFFGSNAVSKEYVESMSDGFIKAGSVFKGEL